MDWGLRGLEVHYHSFDAADTWRAWPPSRRPADCSPPGAATTMATTWTTPPPRAVRGCPMPSAERLLEALEARRGMTARTLPVLDLVAPGAAAGLAAPRSAAATERRGRRVRDRRPGAAALPRLDAGLPDEPLRFGGDGRLAAGGRLLGGGVARSGGARGHQHLRHPRGRRAEGHRPDGRARAASRPPTRACGSCSPAAPCGRTTAPGSRRRYPAVDLFLRPDEEPELAARLGLLAPTSPGLAGAAPPAGLARVERGTAATADRLTVTRAAAVYGERVARGSATHAWLPIIYGCDKTCTYCIVPFSRGPERSRPFDDILEEARCAGGGRIPGGHAPGPERELLGPRPAARSRGSPTSRPPATWAATCRWTGGRTSPRCCARSTRLRTAGRSPGDPAAALHHLPPVGPGRAPHRCHGGVAVSVCEHLHLPVQSGDDAVLRRMGRQYTADAYLRLVERLRARSRASR